MVPYHPQYHTMHSKSTFRVIARVTWSNGSEDELLSIFKLPVPHVYRDADLQF